LWNVGRQVKAESSGGKYFTANNGEPYVFLRETFGFENINILGKLDSLSESECRIQSDLPRREESRGKEYLDSIPTLHLEDLQN